MGLFISICIEAIIYQYRNNDEDYEIYYSKYEDSVAIKKRITYPQIKGLKNVEMESKINTLLYEVATSSEVFENGDYQQEITCEVKRKDEDILSVLFSEFTINSPTGYVYYESYAVTIDMHTGKKMQLADFISMEELSENFLDGCFTNTNEMADDLMLGEALNILRYGVYVPLNVMETSECEEIKEHYSDFFVSDNGIGIILQIAKNYLIYEMAFEGR